jgi:hypothetical protein
MMPLLIASITSPASLNTLAFLSAQTKDALSKVLRSSSLLEGRAPRLITRTSSARSSPSKTGVG